MKYLQSYQRRRCQEQLCSNFSLCKFLQDWFPHTATKVWQQYDFSCSSYNGVVYLTIQIVNLRILRACLIARIRAAIGPLHLGSCDHNFPKNILYMGYNRNRKDIEKYTKMAKCEAHGWCQYIKLQPDNRCLFKPSKMQWLAAGLQ